MCPGESQQMVVVARSGEQRLRRIGARARLVRAFVGSERRRCELRCGIVACSGGAGKTDARDEAASFTGTEGRNGGGAGGEERERETGVEREWP